MSEEAAPEAAAPAPAKSGGGLMPILAVIILMPAISFGMTQYLIVPKIKATIAETTLLAKSGALKPEAGHGHAKEPAKGGHGGGHGKEGGKDGEQASGKFAYDFDNIVVNLAGAMGSRYLKASFTVFSTNPDLKKLVEENKKQLLDTCIGVLGTRSMADLEAGGAKNVVRSDLIANINSALSSDLVEQLYFSEFVVQ